MEDIHSESYVKGLFNEMSQTYGIVNILSSLGFWILVLKEHRISSQNLPIP